MPRFEQNIGGQKGYAMQRQSNYMTYSRNGSPTLSGKHSLAIKKAESEVGIFFSEKAALRVYTMPDFYADLNATLRLDGKSGMQANGALIKEIHLAIQGHTETGIVYRGVKVPKTEHERYQPGFKFLWPGFTSTSRSENCAKKFGSYFGSGDEVLFKIDLNGVGTTYARDVSDVSVFPGEQEVLITCYSGFEVLERRWENGHLLIRLRTYDAELIENNSRSSY